MTETKFPIFADANDLLPQLVLLPGWGRVMVMQAPLTSQPEAILLARPELGGEVASRLAALVGASEVMDPREFFARGLMRNVRRVGVIYPLLDDLNLSIFVRL